MKYGRNVIGLRPFTDRDGNIAYVGEAQGLVQTDFTEGVFFTVFVSQEGREELQMSPLDHRQVISRKERYQSSKDDEEYDSDEEEFADEEQERE